MLDLNTLIPPGSGVQLVYAFNINDRGEILAISNPLGVTPNTDLGRLVLLIPCEAGEEGCVDSDEVATTAAPRIPAPVNNLVTTASPQRLRTPREHMAAWRAQMLRRYHIPVVGAPKQ